MSYYRRSASPVVPFDGILVVREQKGTPFEMSLGVLRVAYSVSGWGAAYHGVAQGGVVGTSTCVPWTADTRPEEVLEAVVARVVRLAQGTAQQNSSSIDMPSGLPAGALLGVESSSTGSSHRLLLENGRPIVTQLAEAGMSRDTFTQYGRLCVLDCAMFVAPATAAKAADVSVAAASKAASRAALRRARAQEAREQLTHRAAGSYRNPAVAGDALSNLFVSASAAVAAAADAKASEADEAQMRKRVDVLRAEWNQLGASRVGGELQELRERARQLEAELDALSR
jgi:hypothetical protein